MELLPAAVYQSPSRQGRRAILNTIVEEQREGSSGSSYHESGTDTDEGTVIYNPLSPRGTHTMLGMNGQGPYARPVLASGPQMKVQRQSVDSDAETEFSDSFSFRDSMSSRPTSFATESTRSSIASVGSSKNRYPAIIIPTSILPPSITTPLKSSSVPPTPPAKIAVSPAALSMLSRCLPAINAPPSLDGSSMTSDHVSNISAPPTPDTRSLQLSGDWDNQHAIIHLQRDGYSESGDRDSDILIEQPIDWDEVGLFPRIPGATPQDMSPIEPDIRGLGVLHGATNDQGVMLPAGALRTLSQLEPVRTQHLGSDISQNDQNEMRESLKPGAVGRRHSVDASTPSSASECLSALSIPSPGGFFSSLKSGTRHTWFPTSAIKSNPPSSATAENFYNAPWNQPQNIVEQVIEIDDDATEGPETARNIFSFDEPQTAKRIEVQDTTADQDSANGTESIPSSIETVKQRSESPIRYEYEEAYESELLEHAAVYLDRTSTWLAAQSSYLSALRETNPVNDVTEPLEPSKEVIEESKAALEVPVKKGVRFTEAEKLDKDDSSEICQREEHAYFHAFQHLEQHSRRHDSFSRGTSRFEAVQASRIALGSEHVDQLRGKYAVQEPSRPKYCGPFSQNPRATGLNFTSEQMEFMKVEREKGVLDQASPSFWVVDALKYLNGGNLLLSSASKRLTAAKAPEPSDKAHKRVRALDLGGNSSGDWAWHCARQYPNVETCTVVTSTENTNTSVTGPANHRLVTAPQLWKLPFPKNHFDLISARSLHALLKKEPAGDGEADEYDLCLNECYRVLKPGGYLEFLVMDSDMTQPGPLANAMSVEFGFKLKTRGYDPLPTKPFLQRLRSAKMVDIKRAWMFMPAGSPTQESRPARETPFPVPTSTEGAEAVHGPVGSTANVGNVTGLLGSWMWEQWMLKLQMEMGVEGDKLLKGMAPVLEESRNCGAGWRCLSGWARKPSASKKSKPKALSIAKAKALPRMMEQPSSPPPTSPLPTSPLRQVVVNGNTVGNGPRHAKAPSAETIHVKIEGLMEMGPAWF